jgi:hypothetical protein
MRRTATFFPGNGEFDIAWVAVRSEPLSIT